MAVEAEPPVVTSDSDVVALPDPAQAAKDEQEKAESERVTSIVESLGLKVLYSMPVSELKAQLHVTTDREHQIDRSW
jgi:hypothetical protein